MSTRPPRRRRLPLGKEGLLEWTFIPVQVPLPIEALFRDDVDIAEPLDRTTAA
ncbi:hypothetical protein [Pseudonocardia adelaidensis]|uniref:hypothetical protein n=1 Tax=Pseudonocardia adelaidensis TaxID=648754 RepID=UPI0031E4F2A5